MKLSRIKEEYRRYPPKAPSEAASVSDRQRQLANAIIQSHAPCLSTECAVSANAHHYRCNEPWCDCVCHDVDVMSRDW